MILEIRSQPLRGASSVFWAIISLHIQVEPRRITYGDPSDAGPAWSISSGACQ